MSFPGEVFFDFPSLPVVFVGLAYMVARPRRLNLFLFLAFLVGLTPHALSVDPHSAKLMGLVPPLLLLGSLAVDRVATALSVRKISHRIFVAGLVVYVLLGATLMYRRNYVWLQPKASLDVSLYRHTVQDRAAGRRVLVLSKGELFQHDEKCPQAICALNEGLEAGFLWDENRVLWLTADEQPHDVTVYFKSSLADVRARLQREYPGAQFEDYRVYPNDRPEDLPVFTRALLPAGEVPEIARNVEPSRWVSYRRGAPGEWRRRFYGSRFGFIPGMLATEDWNTEPSAPQPAGTIAFLGIVEGTAHFPAEANYTFSVESINDTVIEVDGKRVLFLKTWKEQSPVQTVLKLKGGDHAVRLLVYFRQNPEMPKVNIRYPDGSVRLLGA
jgi:hypothetical protein